MKQTITFMERMLLMLVAFIAVLPVSAYNFKAENEDGITIYYTLKDGKAIVTKGDAGYSGDIVIPEKVINNGTEYSVTEISYDAFGNAELLTSVSIPTTITELPDMCFQNCYTLSSVLLPNTLKAIPQGAFRNCLSLTNITIPNAVTLIGTQAFFMCESLTTIDIPESVTTLASHAFSSCSKLQTISLPNSLKNIAKDVFILCKNIKSVYSNIEAPFVVDMFPAEIFKSATLYVPQGTKAAYAATQGWNFTKIVEIQETTDIKLTASDLTLRKGEQSKLTFSLNNGETKIISIQFDLTLPEGISITDVESHGRCAGFRLRTSKEPVNGKRTVVCYSEDTENIKAIADTEGPLFSFLLETTEDLAEEQFLGKIDNVILVQENHTKLYPAESTFSITFDNTLMGDVNSDGSVDVDDVTLIATFIIYKQTKEDFSVAAADMDKDGVIDVADITLVVKTIMEQGTSDARKLADAIQTDDKLTLQNLGNGNFAVTLNNRNDYVASQFDIKVLPGTTISNMSLNAKRCGNHLLNYQRVADDTYRVIIYSLNNEDYQGSEGRLLTFQTVGTAEDMNIVQALFVDTNHQKFFFENIPVVTSINTVVNTAKVSSPIYTIDGRQTSSASNLKKGLYIVDGKKIIK